MPFWASATISASPACRTSPMCRSSHVWGRASTVSGSVCCVWAACSASAGGSVPSSGVSALSLGSSAGVSSPVSTGSASTSGWSAAASASPSQPSKKASVVSGSCSGIWFMFSSILASFPGLVWPDLCIFKAWSGFADKTKTRPQETAFAVLMASLGSRFYSVFRGKGTSVSSSRPSKMVG